MLQFPFLCSSTRPVTYFCPLSICSTESPSTSTAYLISLLVISIFITSLFSTVSLCEPITAISHDAALFLIVLLSFCLFPPAISPGLLFVLIGWTRIPLFLLLSFIIH